VLRALVEYYTEHPELIPDELRVRPRSDAAVRAAVTYVAGMTDRYSFELAVHHLNWPRERLPHGIDRDT
jgi:dGTPase